MNTITITESHDGWAASDGRRWPTAAEADRAIRATAPEGILFVHWATTSPAGAWVVKAITS